MINTGQHGTKPYHLGPYQTILYGPYGTMTIWDHKNLKGDKWNHKGSHGMLRKQTRSYGAIRDSTGKYMTIWDHTGPSVTKFPLTFVKNP